MNAVLLLRGGTEALAWLGASIVGYLSAISATFLVAQRFNGIGRWSRAEVVFMLGYAMLVNALLEMFASYNVRMISRRIGRGQLDHTLLQPQPLWLSLATEGFAPLDEAAAVLIAAALMAWSSHAAGVRGGLEWTVLLALNVAASMVVLLAFQYGWGSVAFWAPRSAEEINSSSSRFTTQLSGLPLDSVGPALRDSLLTAIPVGLLAWFPCRALLGVSPRVPFGTFLTPAVAIILGAVALWLFHRGLRHYVRTGSNRYLAFGHRR